VTPARHFSAINFSASPPPSSVGWAVPTANALQAVIHREAREWKTADAGFTLCRPDRTLYNSGYLAQLVNRRRARFLRAGCHCPAGWLCPQCEGCMGNARGPRQDSLGSDNSRLALGWKAGSCRLAGWSPPRGRRCVPLARPVRTVLDSDREQLARIIHQPQGASPRLQHHSTETGR
jgi:hypothetical protein